MNLDLLGYLSFRLQTRRWKCLSTLIQGILLLLPPLTYFAILNFALFPSAGIYAMERIRFGHLSTNDGLSQSTVNSIAQDRDGFLWFGTQDGLNRYDGYEFTIFRHDFGDPSSISDNYIWCVLHARDGDMWVGTLHGGLDRYDRSTGKFEHFQHADDDSTSLPADDVTCLVEDSGGTLWVGTWGGGMASFDPQSRRFIRYMHRQDDKESLPDDRVRSLWEDPQGTIWIGTWNGLACIPSGQRRTPKTVARGPAFQEIFCVSGDRHHNVFVGTNGHGVSMIGPDGSHRAPSGSLRTLLDALTTVSVCFLYEDRSGRYWIGTNDRGLMSWVPGQQQPASHTSTPEFPDGVSSTQVTAVWEDATGALWFGTNGDGVRRFDKRWERFHTFRSNPRAARALSNGDVRAIYCESSRRTWVGTLGGGLNLFSPDAGTFASYDHIPGHPREKIGDKIVALTADAGGRLWIATGGSGVLVWDPVSNRFARYVHDPGAGGSLAAGLAYCLCWDHQGTLWVGTLAAGLDRLDPFTNRFVHYVPNPTNSNSLSGSTVYSLHEDRIGNLWVGTWGRGLTVLDSSRTRFSRYFHDPQDSTSLSNNTVLCIVEDSSGILWIGTQGGGFDRFEAGRRAFTRFTDRNGLPNNVINGILPDNQGRLWISTNSGLSRFDVKTETFLNFDVRDGLQSNEFNQGASFRANNGSMYFGGIDGLTVFHPDSVHENAWAPPVILTNFKVFDKPARFSRPVSLLDSIALPYAQNFFSFEFVALDFFNPLKVKYRYMMEGFDRDWVYAGARRYASYTHLDPGNYVFHVSASNVGVWTQMAHPIHIRIIPPLWETWWFRMGGIIIVVGLMVGVYRRRVNTLQRERRKQQEFSLQLMESQENERKRIAGELHDSLGQNLLVIRNRALLGLKDPDVSSLARDQLNQISSVATQAIDEVREISYGLRPYQLDRLGLTKAISSITSGLATPVQFSMSVDPIDDEVGKDEAIHVYRIVQEGINNVLKHATASEARVVIRAETNALHITISDNGKGMSSESLPESNRRQGFGLVGITERAKVLNGSVTVESTPGKGTTLTVSIPRIKKPQ